jgi:hypothetical protein
VVATLLGIRNGSRYVMIRISMRVKMVELLAGSVDHRAHHGSAAQRWRASSISRSAITPITPLRRQALPLADLSAALSWRGLPYALRDRAARIAPLSKTHGDLKRALGKPPRAKRINHRAQRPRSYRSATVAGIVRLFFLCSQKITIVAAAEAYARLGSRATGECFLEVFLGEPTCQPISIITTPNRPS